MRRTVKRNLICSIALMLAILITIGIGSHFMDSALKATDSDEIAEAVETEPVNEVVVQEIVVETAETTAEQPEESTEEILLEEQEDPAEIPEIVEETDESESAEPVDSNEETTTANAIEVTVAHEILTEGEVTFGSQIKLSALVQGEYDSLHYQWQISNDNIQWNDIENENGSSYIFTYDENNYQSFVRVVVVEG